MRSRRVSSFCLALFCLAAAGGAQNLVANGNFNTDLLAWQASSSNGSAAFSSLDSSGSPSSGSAFLTGTNPINGVLDTFLTQCVSVAAGTPYAISNRVQFSTGETTTGWAEIAIYWMSGSNCGGSYISGAGLLAAKTASGVWSSYADTATAPAGALSAYLQLGIDKIDAGGSLSAYMDDVVFAPVGTPAEALVGYLTVASSTPGVGGSFFKTSVQLLNPNFGPISGHLVFHPAGVSASATDPTIGYSLAAGQTTFWVDIVAAMGRVGVGSIDVYASAGNAPIVLTRIFNDAGAAGTSGFTEPLIQPSDVQGGLGVAVTGFLLGPYDTAAFRYNIGIRTLDAPVSVTATVMSASGATLTSVTRSYPANYFEQRSSGDFLGGFALGNGQSIRITFSGGGLIVYGATVDNVTQDPSAQFMPYVFAIA